MTEENEKDAFGRGVLIGFICVGGSFLILFVLNQYVIDPYSEWFRRNWIECILFAVNLLHFWYISKVAKNVEKSKGFFLVFFGGFIFYLMLHHKNFV